MDSEQAEGKLSSVSATGASGNDTDYCSIPHVTFSHKVKFKELARLPSPPLSCITQL